MWIRQGELFFVPILIGVAAGAAIDVAFQLFENGGRWDCIDGKSVAISAAEGDWREAG